MVNGEKERVSLLFMKALVSRGSVDAVSQQMASHPRYLESFLRTQHYILHMDGPLPLPYRHYIAIMVSDQTVLVSAHLESLTGCFPTAHVAKQTHNSLVFFAPQGSYRYYSKLKNNKL